MRIAICIITYRRPEGLRRALDAIGAQVLDRPASPRIVVVDNDDAGSAREVCDAARAALTLPLEYAIEPRRGIPFARNRCVAIARPHADWIAFVDDDEEPAPGWLAELLRVQAEHSADVVTGPVVPRVAGELPTWAVRGRLFQRPRFPTGARRNRAFTNNVLFRAEIFDRVQPHFDDRMAMTGGSDAHFSRRVHRAGYRIVWADRAEVHEALPASRITPGWLYQRAYRTGTTNAFIHRDLRPLPVAVALITCISIYRLGSGALQAAAGCAVGRHWIVSGLRWVCYGAGLLVGLAGGRYNEYRRTHGS
jgi:glycosyltransferase involved in cell wall biosynthesis